MWLRGGEPGVYGGVVVVVFGASWRLAARVGRPATDCFAAVEGCDAGSSEEEGWRTGLDKLFWASG
ncbi:hypothetical protein RchiOBHm_Chr7g0197591 [Rosa chinensis]|uniref:Uncharacterized protein n=1 Tax=Rosa chinensis TaxID=74649 RepID=A0A2P6P6W4_ROSCH|nr:hypothetical protein RchiOBHm_Chr7g0197591 [Rosa chinensis]